MVIEHREIGRDVIEPGPRERTRGAELVEPYAHADALTGSQRGQALLIRRPIGERRSTLNLPVRAPNDEAELIRTQKHALGLTAAIAYRDHHVDVRRRCGVRTFDHQQLEPR